MLNFIKGTALALAFGLTAGAASAAVLLIDPVVSEGDDELAFGTVFNGDPAEFEYTADGDIKINEFSLTANGFSSTGQNIKNLTIEVVSPTGSVTQFAFDPVNSGATLSNSEEIFGGFNVLDGQTFAINVFVTGPGANNLPVALTLAFQAVAVPLPASGLLLLGALGAAAAVRRRKSAAATA